MVKCTKGMWTNNLGDEKVYPFEVGPNYFNDFYSRYRYSPMFVNRANNCLVYKEMRDESDDFKSCINCWYARLGDKRILGDKPPQEV